MIIEEARDEGTGVYMTGSCRFVPSVETVFSS